MRRLPMIRLVVALLAAVAALSACAQIDQAQQGVDKAQECATLAGKVTGINLNPQAAPGEIERAARDLEETVNGLTSEDVKSAGNALVGKLDQLQQALRDADPAKVRSALADVRSTAEDLARTCNIPVDQLLGQ